MVVDHEEAMRFITCYKLVLLESAARSDTLRGQALLKVLVAARAQLCEEPSRLDRAIGRLNAKSKSIAPELLSAIGSVQLDKWVYLRDTSAYSVFIHPSEPKGFGVLGLTDRVRDISGGSGVILKTGIVRYMGRYVCDGLVSRLASLGPNYRNAFNERYRELRQSGRFHVRCAA
jgi:hypothetical protein